MAKVTKSTRAGNNGKGLICPKCGGEIIVYHFAWCDCTCLLYVAKDIYDWIIKEKING